MSTFKLNNFIKISIIFIMLLLLLAPSYSFNENDYTHAYTVPVVVNFINITDDGQCHHSDEVTYTLDESNNIVHYTIAKSSNEVIDNISIESDSIYCDYEVEDTDDVINIKASLYSDVSRKNKITNKSVKIIYHYRSLNSIDLYNDVAVFNYTPWADSTSTVSKLESYITYPATHDDITIYDNPPYLISSRSWVNDYRHETRYKQITADNNLKQVALIPKESFKSGVYTNNINQDNKDSLIGYQEDYLKNVNRNNNLAYILIAATLLLIVMPLAISFKYFKNSEVKNIRYDTIDDFDDDYIRVNMILNDNKKRVNEDAFYATILELINKNFINTRHTGDKLYLTINNNDNYLKSHEKLVFNYLSEYIEEGILLDDIRQVMDKDELKGTYAEFTSLCSEDYSIDNLFEDRTSKALKYYSITAGAYLIAALILINVLNPSVPLFTWVFRSLMVLILMIIFAYMLSRRIRFNWNKEGKLHHDAWKQFEAYLSDYSLMEANTPKMPRTLANYIVYSASIGVDLSFRQNLIRYVNQNDKGLVEKNDLIRLFYYDNNRSLYLLDS